MIGYIVLENYLPVLTLLHFHIGKITLKLVATFHVNIYFKLGRGNNKEVLKTTRYFDGMQQNQVVDSVQVIDSTYFELLGYSLYDTSFVYDTSL